MSRKNVSDAISRSNSIILPREYSVFDGSQRIANNRDFKIQQRDGDENVT